VNKPVAILGSGPAALLAAHAVGLVGQPIAMFSLGLPSQISGAQFLHTAIPELTDPEPDFQVTYVVRGDADTYQRKVYGDTKPGFVSFSNVHNGMQQPAWNLAALYDRLWSTWANSMNVVDVDTTWLDETAGDFQFIISTIPAPHLCRHKPSDETDKVHHFTSQSIKVAEECIEPVLRNTVVYDGSTHRSWYRSSNLQDVCGTEWGGDASPPLPNLRTLTKPLRTTCDCNPDVVRVGRFGTWTKGHLVSDAFIETVKALHARNLLPPR
jgi:hypothetical protein